MVLIIYVISLAVIATSCFILGFFVYKRDAASVINRLFFINSLLLNGVIVLTLMIQFFEDASIVVMLQSIYNIVLIIFLLESLYFNLVFVKGRLPFKLLVLLLTFTSAVMVIFIFFGHNLFEITRKDNFNVYKLLNNYFWFLLYTPLLTLVVALMLYHLHAFSKSAVKKKERKQARIMMISILISCFSGYLVLMIFPVFDVASIPLLTPYFFAIYLYGVFYAITRFNFMSFRLEDIAREVFSHIQDMVVILSPELTVMDANRPGEKYFEGPGFISGSNIFEYIKDDEDLKLMFESLIRGGMDSFNCWITYKAGEENVVTDSYVSRVSDRFGDATAILIVSRANPGIEQFRKYFKLTEREMNIVMHTISGISNLDIAEKLKITKRTVETHQNNIYNKMKISNKLELFRTAGDFGIQGRNQNRASLE